MLNFFTKFLKAINCFIFIYKFYTNKLIGFQALLFIRPLLNMMISSNIVNNKMWNEKIE